MHQSNVKELPEWPALEQCLAKALLSLRDEIPAILGMEPPIMLLMGNHEENILIVANLTSDEAISKVLELATRKMDKVNKEEDSSHV